MTELIAEIGLAHEGSLGLAHSYIDSVSALGLDTVKFQMHIAESESSSYEKFRINFSYEDKTRFEYWDRTSFTNEEWQKLIKHAEIKKLNFLISPFSAKALEEINRLGLKRIKLGSAEVVDDLILNRSLDYGFEYIISNGFCGDSIFETIELFKKRDKNLSVLECISKYPCSNDDFNHVRFKSLFNKNIGVGVSDHSGDISIPKYAIALGADIIEAHIVFDKKMFGPDSSSSLEISQWSEIVKFRNDIKQIENKKAFVLDNKMKRIFSRSLSFNKNLKKDHKISIFDFESKKANGLGIPSCEFKTFIDKKLLKDVSKGDFVKRSDFN